jgi:hypothetical protein
MYVAFANAKIVSSIVLELWNRKSQGDIGRYVTSTPGTMRDSTSQASENRQRFMDMCSLIK